MRAWPACDHALQATPADTLAMLPPQPKRGAVGAAAHAAQSVTAGAKPALRRPAPVQTAGAEPAICLRLELDRVPPGVVGAAVVGLQPIHQLTVSPLPAGGPHPPR